MIPELTELPRLIVGVVISLAVGLPTWCAFYFAQKVLEQASEIEQWKEKYREALAVQEQYHSQLVEETKKKSRAWSSDLLRRAAAGPGVLEDIAERAREKEQTLARQFTALELLVYTNRNFLDPDYRDHYAQVNRDRIISEMKAVWAKERLDLMHQPDLFALLKEKAPQVLDFYDARNDVVLRAERLAVAPALPPAPREKETPEEFRKRVMAREETTIRDQRAMFKMAAKSRKQILMDRDAEIKKVENNKRLNDEQIKEYKDEIKKIAEAQLQSTDSGDTATIV